MMFQKIKLIYVIIIKLNNMLINKLENHWINKNMKLVILWYVNSTLNTIKQLILIKIVNIKYYLLIIICIN